MDSDDDDAFLYGDSADTKPVIPPPAKPPVKIEPSKSEFETKTKRNSRHAAISIRFDSLRGVN